MLVMALSCTSHVRTMWLAPVLALACLLFPGTSHTQPVQPNAVSRPADSLATADSLDEKASCLDQQGNMPGAIAALEAALAIRERILGSAHLAIAETCETLGILHLTKGAHRKAEPFLMRAIAIREKTLGHDHPATITSIGLLAALRRAEGMHDSAIPLFERVLIARRSYLGPEHADTLHSMDDLAAAYLSEGMLAQAEPLMARALAVSEKLLGPEHAVTARRMNDLAVVRLRTDNFAGAEPLLVRALAVRTMILGPEHADTATTMNNLAFLYRSTGAYAKAEPLYERALAIRTSQFGLTHPLTVESINNLAVLYTVTGAFDQAESLYMHVITRSIGSVKNGAPAEDATAVHRTMHNLGGVYSSIGADDKAAIVHAQALAAAEKMFGPNHSNTALSLFSLGSVYVSAGDYVKAEPLLIRALEITKKNMGSENKNVAAITNSLAILYEFAGFYAKAESMFARALAINETVLGPEHPTTAASLKNLATLHSAAGDHAKARRLLLRSQSITEVNVSRLLLHNSERRRRQYMNTLVIDDDIALSLTDPSAEAATLGATAVLQLKGRVLDASSESIGRLRSNLDDYSKTLLTELTQVVAQRAEVSLQQDDRAPQVRQRLDALAARQERLENELSQRSSAFQQAIQPVTLKRVQQVIPSSNVLVEWIRFESFDPKGRRIKDRSGAARYAVYLVTKDDSPAVVDLGDAATIEAAIERLHEELRRPGYGHPRAARDLFNLVVQPLLGRLSKLRPQCRRLLLSPDGMLNLVPFAALVDAQGRYLGQRFELNYLTSGRDLLRLDLDRSERSSDGMMVIAAPDYDQMADGKAGGESGTAGPAPSADFDRTSMTFKPLPGTASEAALLQRLFKLDSSHVAIAAAASEVRVKNLHGPRILHVATHGFFLRSQPAAALDFTRGTVEFASVDAAPQSAGENSLLHSGLALAGANTRSSKGGEDGILTAAEAAQLDLKGTQLVVLSACETGVGDLANGEGIYGLRRALVLAGAKSLLVSLWKVNDAATEKLMSEYYRRLAKGEGRAQALRAAQQAMRSKAATAHPFFWAAFVPLGDWRPVPLH